MTKKKKDYTMWIIIGAIALLAILMFSCTPRAGGNTFLIVQNPSQDNDDGSSVSGVTTTTTSVTTTTSGGLFDWFGLITTTTLPSVDLLYPTLPMPDSPTCTDSDSSAARPSSVFGQCLDGGAAYKSDVCVDDRTVREYRCEGVCVFSDIPCPDGFNCVSGACQRAVCGDLKMPRSVADCQATYDCRTGTICMYLAVPFYERGDDYCACVSTTPAP